jgi:hypothetical protein
LSRRYEDLREAVESGTAYLRIGLSVMLNQGMWAWVELVGSELSKPGQGLCNESKPLSSETKQPFLVSCPALLGVWTDLLLCRLTAQEAR